MLLRPLPPILNVNVYMLHTVRERCGHRPVHEFQHDTLKLMRKPGTNLGRRYKLKTIGDKLVPCEVLPQKHKLTLPTHVDLTKHSYMPKVLDQGRLGICASSAMANNIDYLLGQKGMSHMRPSRLALYYNTRVLIAKESAHQDTGVQLGHMCEAVRRYGVCPEALWPFTLSSFGAMPPILNGTPSVLFSGSPIHRMDVKTCLASGIPVLFGMQVHDSFESLAVAETGIVPLPDLSVEASLGAQAMLLVGYCDEVQAFLAQNTFGARWGADGYAALPYDFVFEPTLASDFWCMGSWLR